MKETKKKRKKEEKRKKRKKKEKKRKKKRKEERERERDTHGEGEVEVQRQHGFLQGRFLVHRTRQVHQVPGRGHWRRLTHYATATWCQKHKVTSHILARQKSPSQPFEEGHWFPVTFFGWNSFSHTQLLPFTTNTQSKRGWGLDADTRPSFFFFFCWTSPLTCSSRGCIGRRHCCSEGRGAAETALNPPPSQHNTRHSFTVEIHIHV